MKITLKELRSLIRESVKDSLGYGEKRYPSGSPAIEWSGSRYEDPNSEKATKLNKIGELVWNWVKTLSAKELSEIDTNNIDTNNPAVVKLMNDLSSEDKEYLISRMKRFVSTLKLSLKKL